MRTSTALLAFLVWILSAFTPPVRACNIPVFRHALERWPADAYEVVVFHRGALTLAEQTTVDELRKACSARPAAPNCSVELVDVAQPLAKAHQELWQTQPSPTLPWMVVRFPESDEDRPPVWVGPLNREIIPPLFDSPARRELGRRLLRGESVVWLLLASGDPQKDQAAADLLQKELKRLEPMLPLPEDDGQGSVPLLSELPLRITFSVLRVARDDPAEKLLVPMLLRMEKAEGKPLEPMVFPVFGRGRVLGSLAGSEFTAKGIQEVAEFLCGACSCRVKVLNPGLDLLLAADWEGILENRSEHEADRPAQGEVIPIPPGTATPIARPAQDGLASLDQTTRSLLPFLIGGASVLVVASGGWVWWAQRRKTR